MRLYDLQHRLNQATYESKLNILDGCIDIELLEEIVRLRDAYRQALNCGCSDIDPSLCNRSVVSDPKFANIYGHGVLCQCQCH